MQGQLLLQSHSLEVIAQHLDSPNHFSIVKSVLKITTVLRRQIIDTNIRAPMVPFVLRVQLAQFLVHQAFTVIEKMVNK
jgi:hypothetical protein